MKFLSTLASALLLILAGCGKDPVQGEAPEQVAAVPTDAMASITAEDIRAHVAVLSSDEFEGRGPGTPGAAKAVNYLIEQMKALGLAPGNNGSWHQEVPLRRIRNTNLGATITGEDFDLELERGRDYVAENRRGDGIHQVKGDLVFVGFGVQAPEYQWDDYKGLDCKGKVLVMLVGDPPTADTELFGGEAMTYYGRWTYKYDKARDMGAAACILIHKSAWAGYGWPVVANSWNGVHVNVVAENAAREAAFEGWVNWEIGEKLVAKTGKTLDQLSALAATREFEPIALGLELEAGIRTTTEDFTDENVVGLALGKDPFRKSECVVLTAHWDHLGKGEGKPDEDSIYNGAVDNASGCAVVLEIAQAIASLKGNHGRSVLFLFVCSEEQGLLGSRYYAENPIIAPKQTVANINVDGANLWDRTSDVEVIGYGQSELDGILSAILAGDGREVQPDSEPQKGLYYRSDHFNFARIGIPALYVKGGVKVPGKPDGWLKEKKDLWTQNDYHRPSDELRADMSAKGAEADARALFSVVHQLVTGKSWPAWSEKSEFRATSLKSRSRP